MNSKDTKVSKKQPRPRETVQPELDPKVVFSSSEGWILTRVGESGVGERRTAQTGASSAVAGILPDFMRENGFEVIDAVEASPAPGRRAAVDFSPSEVRLSASVPIDAATILVVRQESGAVSFHRPVMRPTAHGRRRAADSVEVIFDVPVLHGDTAFERRGPISALIRAVLVKVVNAVAGAVIEHAMEWAVPRLASTLEERLWKGRAHGWVRVTRDGLIGDKLLAAKPQFPKSQRGLLLVHGIFSDVSGTFRALAKGEFLEQARRVYGDNIFGFNHFSFSKTPEENVRELLDALPDSEFSFDVIAYSRGGLVMRELLENSGRSHSNASRLKIRNLILVATPCTGSPLGSPASFGKKLSWLANLLELVPENPFTTAAAWLAEALGWFAQNVAGNTPGLVAMDPKGELIARLQEPPGPPPGVNYFALTANFHPPRDWWMRLADMGIDAFFNSANDLAVWTEGVWKTAAYAEEWVPASRIGCFGPGGNLCPEDPGAVNHLNFFHHSETSRFLLSSLHGEPLDLPEVRPAELLTRIHRRALVGPNGAPSATVQIRTLHDTRKLEEKTAVAEVAITPQFKTFGWAVEDDLFLTVISNDYVTRVEAMEDSNRAIPMLFATYGSARVAVPFYTRGQENNAGRRWQRLIALHRFMVDYANGNESECRLPDGSVVSEPDEAFLKAFGQDLFETLFPSEVRRLYDAARFRHEKRRLNIIFTSMIPWVADFPWEFAYDPSSETFLSVGDVRFVRNVLSPVPADRIKEKNCRLRILVVSAQPKGAGFLSIEDERRSIVGAFDPLIAAGLVEVEPLPSATPEKLHEILRRTPRGEEFDIVHFIGHGEFDETTRMGYLLFEDETGRSRSLPAEQLLDILRSRGIRIVCLNACETGRGGRADYNRGVAMALVRDGVPAVIANQYSVLDRSASLFSLHFYACVACGLSLGDAMREARIAIRYSGVESTDWGVPVLFARNPNARMCASASPGSAAPTSPIRAWAASPGGVRGTQSTARFNVAVWDVANLLPYRENLESILTEMNAAQEQFSFQLERITAPRNLWMTDSNPDTDGVAYLQYEKVIIRLPKIRKHLGASHLFCVTDLPLRDEETTALYLKGSDQCTIFSIWGFEPPIEGPLFKPAFVNSVALGLFNALFKTECKPDEPKFTVGYYNRERAVDHIAGKLTVPQPLAKQLKSESKIKAAQFEALEILLSLFHESAA